MLFRSPIILLGIVLISLPGFAQLGLIAGTTVGLDPVTNNNGQLGCVEYNGRIFITARGLAAAPPHLIYEFDCAGNLVATYQQSTTTAASPWGYRDGCVGIDPSLSPNALLYFGFEGGVEVIDPATMVPPGSPGVPLAPVATFTNATVGLFRGMAWDPTGDGGAGSIWTGDFGGALEEVSATTLGAAGARGVLLATYPSPLPPSDWSIYGLAYDPTTGNLWANSAPNTGLIAEIDITAAPGTLTGTAMDRAAPGELQGGLSPLSPGSPCVPAGSGLAGIVLIGLDQALPDAYSLYDTSPTAFLLTGINGGTQTKAPSVLYGGGTLDWSVVSAPAGTTGITGVAAVTVLNLGTVGTPPGDVFVNNFVPGFTLALTPPFSVPGSNPLTNPSVLVADGFTGGLLFPGFCDASIHGIWPMDLVVDDPTAAVIGPLPAGLFTPGTAIYMQTIFLDGSGSYRATNVSGWNVAAPITVLVEALGANSYNADPNSGFFKVTNVGGVQIDQVHFDWLTSPNPAQATMVFDTDQISMGDIFEGGNSTTPGCLGTYRNGTDSSCGLIYDAMNTVPASPCDPSSNTGWIGSNPAGIDSWKTLDFRFSSFNAAGQIFEVDIDTDGGAGTTGASMNGMVVTVTTPSGTLSGVLAIDPASGGLRSSLQL